MTNSRTRVDLSPIAGKRPESEWRANFILKLTLSMKLKLLATNSAYRYLLLAAFFRMAGGYSIAFWSKKYFTLVFPDYQNEFAIAYFLILIFGSIPSELMGGYITDKYEIKYPWIKGVLSATGAGIGMIFIVFSILIVTNFWIQIVCFYFEFLFAEVFFGPTLAQINMIV